MSSFPTSIWLDEETKGLLGQLEKELGLSRSAVIREAVRLMNSDTDHERAEVRRLVSELSRVVSGQ